MADPAHVTFPALAEWLFRTVPIAISAASFVFALIARRDTRKKVTVHWQSKLVGSSATRTGDPSVVVGIHNTGKRTVSLVEDSYYLYADQAEYYIKMLEPKLLDRNDYPGLLREGDSFRLAIPIANLIDRVLSPETGIDKGDIITLTLAFRDVEGKRYLSTELYSISGWGLIERDENYKARLKAAKESRRRIRSRLRKVQPSGRK